MALESRTRGAQSTELRLDFSLTAPFLLPAVDPDRAAAVHHLLHHHLADILALLAWIETVGGGVDEFIFLVEQGEKSPFRLGELHGSD